MISNLSFASIYCDLKGNKITYILAVVNVAVFLSYGFQDDTFLHLLDLGANFAPFTLNDQSYRLINSMFLHGNIWHLGANMYSLVYLGRQCEGKLGSIKFIEIYFVSGVVAGLASVSFNLFIVSVGASGAIFGLYGYYIIQSLEDKKLTNQVGILVNFVAYLVFMLLISSRFNFDNAGHIGGVVSGFLLRIIDRYLNNTAGKVIAILSPVIIYFFIPRYQVDYFHAYQYFLKSDKKIGSVLNSRLNDVELLDALYKAENIPDSAIEVFRLVDPIPSQLDRDTTSIIQYLDIRDRQIDYYIRGVSNESYIYLDSISYLGSIITKLPKPKYNLNFGAPALSNDTMLKPREKLIFLKQYFDHNWFETDENSADYFRMGRKDSLGDWHGNVEDYFISGAIQMKGQYKRGLRNGIFIFYNEDSTYQSAGRYLTDKKIGKWESFYKNGRMSSEIRFEEKSMIVENTWDSTGNQQVVKRNGKEIIKYPNGNIKYKLSVINGLREGYYENFYENGDLRYRELYDKGKLIKGVSFSENGQNTYDRSVYYAYPIGGYDKFYQYIKEKNTLASDSIEGKVVLGFDVHPSGKLHNFRYLKRLGGEYDQIAKELILSGPEWNPALMHGLTPMQSYAQVSILF